eukprot:1195623-Prorocentrum_minimum.AAC.3
MVWTHVGNIPGLGQSQRRCNPRRNRPTLNARLVAPRPVLIAISKAPTLLPPTLIRRKKTQKDETGPM